MGDEIEESHPFKVHGRHTTRVVPTVKKLWQDGFAPPEYLLLYLILAKRPYHRYCVYFTLPYNILWVFENSQ